MRGAGRLQRKRQLSAHDTVSLPDAVPSKRSPAQRPSARRQALSSLLFFKICPYPLRAPSVLRKGVRARATQSVAGVNAAAQAIGGLRRCGCRPALASAHLHWVHDARSWIGIVAEGSKDPPIGVRRHSTRTRRARERRKPSSRGTGEVSAFAGSPEPPADIWDIHRPGCCAVHWDHGEITHAIAPLVVPFVSVVVPRTPAPGRA